MKWVARLLRVSSVQESPGVAAARSRASRTYSSRLPISRVAERKKKRASERRAAFFVQGSSAS
jgi:hypothetical protein